MNEHVGTGNRLADFVHDLAAKWPTLLKVETRSAFVTRVVVRHIVLHVESGLAGVVVAFPEKDVAA